MTNTFNSMNVVERIKEGLLEEPENWNVYPAPTQPMSVARSLIFDCFTAPGEQPLLVYWRGAFWRYTGTCWQEYTNKLGVRRPVYERLEQCIYINGKGLPAHWSPNRAKVTDVLEPLAILTERDDTATPPFRMEGTRNTPETSMIAMENGLLNLETKQLEDHDPSLFTTWSLPFAYDKNAECPRWTKFLNEVLGHDPAGIEALQQYAGVLVTGDTTRHKLLALIGAKRGGKGTISYMLQQLVGTDNVATTTLHDLASDFGLSSLVGKSVTVLEDARGNAKVNSMATERLLNLVANDTVSVNRKNRDYWTGRLNTRLVLVSNEVPRLPDSSGAIQTRFLTIKMIRTFKPDEQDPHLKDKLTAELPGIFNWALAGYEQLQRQGTFTEPASGADFETTFSELSNPLQVFVDEGNCFEVTGNTSDFMEMTKVLKHYRAWAEAEGRASMNRESLAQDLTAAYPEIQYKNTSLDENGNYDKDAPRRRYLIGVKPINDFRQFVKTAA